MALVKRCSKYAHCVQCNFGLSELLEQTNSSPITSNTVVQSWVWNGILHFTIRWIEVRINMVLVYNMIPCRIWRTSTTKLEVRSVLLLSSKDNWPPFVQSKELKRLLPDRMTDGWAPSTFRRPYHIDLPQRVWNWVIWYDFLTFKGAQ